MMVMTLGGVSRGYRERLKGKSGRQGKWVLRRGIEITILSIGDDK